MFSDMINLLTEAPDTQIAPHLQQKIKEFVSQSHTEQEAYDFLAELSEQPETDISAFVKGCCDVKQYYTRPTN